MNPNCNDPWHLAGCLLACIPPLLLVAVLIESWFNWMEADVNVEQIRQEILDGIDAILAHPLFVTTEQRHLLTAQQQFWSKSNRIGDLAEVMSYMPAQTEDK